MTIPLSLQSFSSTTPVTFTLPASGQMAFVACELHNESGVSVQVDFQNGNPRFLPPQASATYLLTGNERQLIITPQAIPTVTGAVFGTMIYPTDLDVAQFVRGSNLLGGTLVGIPVDPLVVANANTVIIGTEVSGDTVDRWRQRADGTLEWGPGNAPTDFILSRTASGLLTATGAIVPQNPSARVYNNTAISVVNAANQVLTFNSERWDIGGLHSTGSNTSRLTASVAGKYSIFGSVEFALNNVGERILAIRINGVTFIALDSRTPTPTNDTRVSISSLWHLAIGDYVELVVYQDSGGFMNINSSADYSPEFGMQLVGG